MKCRNQNRFHFDHRQGFYRLPLIDLLMSLKLQSLDNLSFLQSKMLRPKRTERLFLEYHFQHRNYQRLVLACLKKLKFCKFRFCKTCRKRRLVVIRQNHNHQLMYGELTIYCFLNEQQDFYNSSCCILITLLIQHLRRQKN